VRNYHKTKKLPPNLGRPATGLPKPWEGCLKLAAALAGLILFVTVIGPGILDLPFYRPVVQFVQENDINVNAYYYTEIEEFAEADFAMRANFTYGPKAIKSR
jgi:hypothetical protein